MEAHVMTLPDRPPAPAALRQALSSLPAGISERAAALHLALPYDVVPAIALRQGRASCCYRGREVHLAEDACTSASDVAAAGHRSGDRYLDLGEEPERWCKLLRSGVRRVLFGTDTLFGAPTIALDSGVDDEVAYEVLRRYRRRELAEVPAVLTAGSGTVLLDGTPGSIVVRSSQACALAPRGPADTSLVEIAEEVRAQLGGLAAEAILLSTTGGVVRAEVVCDLCEGWEAIVPVRITGSAELVGVEANEVGRAAPQLLPEGFTWCGQAVWEDAAVGRHGTSGIVALLRHGQTSAGVPILEE